MLHTYTAKANLVENTQNVSGWLEQQGTPLLLDMWRDIPSFAKDLIKITVKCENYDFIKVDILSSCSLMGNKLELISYWIKRKLNADFNSEFNQQADPMRQSLLAEDLEFELLGYELTNRKIIKLSKKLCGFSICYKTLWS